MPNGGEQFGHTASFTYTDDGHDMILVGFEDWTDDNDYNDFVFNVTGVEGTNFREDKVVTIAGDVTRGTLAFEDNWPNEGDYDMNDVIVKYKSETYYKRTTYLGTSKVEYSKEMCIRDSCRTCRQPQRYFSGDQSRVARHIDRMLCLPEW